MATDPAVEVPRQKAPAESTRLLRVLAFEGCGIRG